MEFDGRYGGGVNKNAEKLPSLGSIPIVKPQPPQEFVEKWAERKARNTKTQSV